MKKIICMLVGLFVGNANAALIQFVAINAVTSPDVSTTFDSLPISAELNDPQTFDGFYFDQINGDINGIATVHNPGGGNGRSWYPNSGDFGYTEISLTSGLDFVGVSMFVGSGNISNTFLAYELLSGSVSFQSGVLSGHQKPYHWLSISGGGFDTIRLRDGDTSGISIGDGSHNALSIDAVYATVPEPTSVTLLGLGLIGIGLSRKRRAN